MLELEFLEIAQQRLVFSANFRNHPGLLFRRLLSGEFLEDFQIGRPGFQGQEWLDLGTKLGNQLDIGLRELLIIPEVRRCHAGLDIGEAPGQGGKVKETSATRRGAQRWRRYRRFRVVQSLPAGSSLELMKGEDVRDPRTIMATFAQP